jgi:uncharacterized protein (TIGR03437 family)
MTRVTRSILIALGGVWLAVAAVKAQTQAPRVFPGGLVNGAHFGFRVAPGAIISIFGERLASATQTASGTPLPKVLGGARVTMGGIDLALFYVSPGQINAQLPFELQHRSTTDLRVSVDGLSSESMAVILGSVAPGIFIVGQGSTAVGAILRARDSSLVTPANPVSRGEAITIFAIGLGPVAPQPPSGSAAGAAPLSWTVQVPTVFIGGVVAPVSYYGLAPGFVGLYQVNAEVPAQAPVGDAAPLVLRVASVSSNTVRLAVR